VPDTGRATWNRTRGHVRFAPVTIAPYGAQLVELVFHPFYDREVYPPGNLFEVEGEQFVFRFDDGSVIAVNP
jgi:hypothetical protein